MQNYIGGNEGKNINKNNIQYDNLVNGNNNMDNNFKIRMNNNINPNKINNNMHYMVNNYMNDEMDNRNFDNTRGNNLNNNMYSAMGSNMNNNSFGKRIGNNVMGNNMNNIINNNNIQNLNNQGINQKINQFLNNNNQMNSSQTQNQTQKEIVTNKNNYEIINKGIGLNDNEINIIIESTFIALNNREDPLSKAIMKRVKSIIGGDWVIFAYTNGLKGYDLSVSTYDEDKIISYSVDCFRFEVIKISD